MACRLLLVLLLALLPTQAPAQQPPLAVGVAESPPFAFKDDAGEWTGIAVELWRGVAVALDREWRFEERPADELIALAGRGELDVALGAVTATPAGEIVADFSYPFYASGFGIAVHDAHRAGWLAVAGRLLSVEFVSIVAAIAALLLGVGFAIWLLERRRNPEQFGGAPMHGIASGFWWSAVTVTTVGYGDKAPRTPGGRVLAIVWMFAGVMLVSAFTAAVTSALTVGTLEVRIKGLRDLPQHSVAAVRGSAAAAFLDQNGIPFHVAERLEDALALLDRRQIDAVVHRAPVLHYLVTRRYAPQIVVLPHTYARQGYVFALPPGSPMREPIDRAVLEAIESDDWLNLLDGFLGAGHAP